MKSLIPWLGPVAFLLLGVYVLSQCGSHWRFGGRYGMPTTLLDESGTAYLDGTSVDAITLALAKSGFEQELCLVLVVVIVASAVWIVIVIRRGQRHRRRIDAMRRELQGLCDFQQQEGAP
jgi:hypothetical protein